VLKDEKLVKILLYFTELKPYCYIYERPLLYQALMAIESAGPQGVNRSQLTKMMGIDYYAIYNYKRKITHWIFFVFPRSTITSTTFPDFTRFLHIDLPS
jgi:hypothetical protein